MRSLFWVPCFSICLSANSLAILDSSSTTNTSPPSDGVPWANVGQVNGGSGEYLGNGWVLTAAHVGAGPIVLDIGTFNPDGRVIRLTNPSDQSPTDIILFHLILTPDLPDLVIASSTPNPSPAANVELIGFGRLRGSAEKTFATYDGQKSGFDWSNSGAKSFGTNKIQTSVETQANLGYGTLEVFALDFTQAGPTRTAHEAQVTTGDSGGGVFYKSGSTWQLLGMIDALGSYVYPQAASVYGDYSYIGNLPTYRSQITPLVASTAGSGKWNGSTSALWATASNWSSNITPGSAGNLTATFNSTANSQTTINLGSGVTINTVLFDSSTAASFIIGSGPANSQNLTLTDGGAITTSNSLSANQRFNAQIILGSDLSTQTYTISNNRAPLSTASLSFDGKIKGPSTTGTPGTKTLAVLGIGHTEFNSPIENGGLAPLAILKSDSGTLTLNAANTHTSITSITGGSLIIANLHALQSSTLDTGSPGPQSVSFSVPGSNTYHLGGLSGADPLDASSNSLSIGANHQSTTFSASITALSLTKVGSGSLTLSGSNSPLNTVTVSEGTLALANLHALQSSTLDTGSPGSQSVSFSVPGSNTYHLGGLSGADPLDASSNSLSIGANHQSSTFSASITALSLTKVGSGSLTLSGPQNYSTLTTTDGITEITAPIGSGTSSVVALATTHFASSQSLASLSIGPNATVSFSSGLAPFSSFTSSPEISTLDSFNPATLSTRPSLSPSIVPEPSVATLLLTSLLALHRRRRPIPHPQP